MGVYGCVCDLGFTGYDCSLRTCERGDDPINPQGGGQVDEIQSFSCSATSGKVVFELYGAYTRDIPFDASAATLEAALVSLPQVSAVTLALSDATICAAGPATFDITF